MRDDFVDEKWRLRCTAKQYFNNNNNGVDDDDHDDNDADDNNMTIYELP